MPYWIIGHGLTLYTQAICLRSVASFCCCSCLCFQVFYYKGGSSHPK
ncbi:hypothetical protein AAZX31_13G304700 [Glycine max]|uniref:Uncharacterized protein n=1 Tax=Glycine max TaxID=3847 RepID=A0A0R0GXD1_SOYBN|nr:hypothetical protein GLYMA_13G323100v4 [Glycine max]